MPAWKRNTKNNLLTYELDIISFFRCKFSWPLDQLLTSFVLDLCSGHVSKSIGGCLAHRPCDHAFGIGENRKYSRTSIRRAENPLWWCICFSFVCYGVPDCPCRRQAAKPPTCLPLYYHRFRQLISTLVQFVHSIAVHIPINVCIYKYLEASANPDIPNRLEHTGVAHLNKIQILQPATASSYRPLRPIATDKKPAEFCNRT